VARRRGTVTFDGNGGLIQQDFIVENAVAPNNQTTNGFRHGETGIYAVYPDCTGKAEIHLPGSSVVLNLTTVISPAAGTMHSVVSSLTVGGNPVLAQTYSDLERIGNGGDGHGR
jgi:hypothetical protein